MTGRLLSVRVEQELDVVAARQRARQIAERLGFDGTEQTRIATAVSELARNAYQYANGGLVHFDLEGYVAPQVLSITVTDHGAGIAQLDEVLSGSYLSATGMGLGIVGTRRLMDHFSVQTGKTGTVVAVKKLLPRRAALVTPEAWRELVQALASERPRGLGEEVRQQNQELLRTLEELRRRQEELERVNGELQDTNRGVVALYAELDERADHLRRADELKTKFLSNMTHEFRTPVNSILALSSLLAERLDSGPDVKDEVFYIRKSAQQLSDLVNDLLDIAKVEAGKVDVRPVPFEVDSLFGALRGMLRPLLVTQTLALLFDDASDLPPVISDDTKVSQILRNFISNALKYTERGEVRVSATLDPTRSSIIFSVSDTGIGIPAKDLDRVFDEFVQIENPLQRRAKGTGLGLPLSKRLAELLGGSVDVVSELGVGSTFRLTLPLIFRDPVSQSPIRIEPGRVAVLVVEDSDEDMLLYERALMGTRFQVVPARSVASALAALQEVRPAAVILDLKLQSDHSWDLLSRIKREDATSGIPVLVISTVDERQKGHALGADACLVKPIGRDLVLSNLESLTSRPVPRVLSIDDEETFRFIIREMLVSDFDVRFAASGEEGLRAVREQQPDLVLLDLELGDISGVDLFERLQSDPGTAGLPVVAVSSRPVSDADLRRFGGRGVLPKSQLSRDRLLGVIRDALVPGASNDRAERNR